METELARYWLLCLRLNVEWERLEAIQATCKRFLGYWMFAEKNKVVLKLQIDRVSSCADCSSMLILSSHWNPNNTVVILPYAHSFFKRYFLNDAHFYFLKSNNVNFSNSASQSLLSFSPCHLFFLCCSWICHSSKTEKCGVWSQELKVRARDEVASDLRADAWNFPYFPALFEEFYESKERVLL